MGLSQVDLSMIPPNGPFSAYVGNLAYEVSDADLEFFFKDLEVCCSHPFSPQYYFYISDVLTFLY